MSRSDPSSSTSFDRMKDYIMADGTVSPGPDPGERRVVWILGLGLLISTLFFTVLHHCFPAVLDVPGNQGIPYADYGSMFILDLIPLVLGWLCFHHAWRRLGIYRAMIFLGGSFVFTGLEESMWILLGRYSQELQAAFPSSQDAMLHSGSHDVSGTYYFTRGFFWFIETPVLACVGWFFVAYSCVYISGLLIPGARILWKATLGGLLAVNLDLWLDPVQTHETFKSWIWAEQDVINIFSIPLSNFMGWFLLIFLFAIVFHRLPGMVRKRGPGRAALYFYLILFALEIGILLFFGIYGTIAMRLLPEPINLTVWGI
jgi:hypothetical protein